MMSYFRLMRAHRPLPILLIVWPTYWGLVLNGQLPALKYFFIFGLGAILMRSAGCVLNDYFDRQLDGHVLRTKDRPLVKGTLKSRQAFILLAFLLACSACLLFFLKPLTIFFSFIALLLAFLYPLAKRVTHFPQFVLGLAFNFGLIMAYLEVNAHITGVMWFWYAFAVIWTLIYDTEYALVDYSDDLKAGIKSTAVFFGRFVFEWIASLSILLMVLLLSDVFFFSIQGILPLFIVGLIIGFLVWQLYQLKRFEDKISMHLFNQHHWLGLLIFWFLLNQHA